MLGFVACTCAPAYNQIRGAAGATWRGCGLPGVTPAYLAGNSARVIIYWWITEGFVAKFQKAGQPSSGFKKLDLHVGETVKIDLTVTKQDTDDIKSLFVACFGTATETKEIASPMPSVIRRFTVTGKSTGSSIFIATPSIPTSPFSLLFLNRGQFRLLLAELPIDVTLTAEQAFIDKLAREGAKIPKEFKIPMSIMLGVACVESAYGAGKHASKNLYGITKRSGQNWFPSCRVTVGGETTATAGQGVTGDSFCQADSYENSARIFAEFITGHPNNGAIKGLLNGGPWTPAELERIAEGLHTGMNFGKGTAPGAYKKTVMAVITQFHLTRFDP